MPDSEPEACESGQDEPPRVRRTGFSSPGLSAPGLTYLPSPPPIRTLTRAQRPGRPRKKRLETEDAVVRPRSGRKSSHGKEKVQDREPLSKNVRDRRRARR